MRGKVKAVNLLRDKFGITPAYAGKRFVYMHKLNIA